MNRLLKVLAAGIPLVAGSMAMAGIAGSSHDFSGSGWSDGEICKPCHTPHNADTSITGALWAHSLNDGSVNYKYHGGSLAGTDGTTSTDGGTGSLNPVTQMDGASRLCLGCHDGTVALDSFMGRVVAEDNKKIGDADGLHGNAKANLGASRAADGSIVLNTVADLSNDHPVGLTAILSQTGSHPYAVGTWNNATKSGTLILGAFSGMLAKTGTDYSVSCVTCHDVHTSADMTRGQGMLRISNTNSALCQTCHNK